MIMTMEDFCWCRFGRLLFYCFCFRLCWCVVAVVFNASTYCCVDLDVDAVTRYMVFATIVGHDVAVAVVVTVHGVDVGVAAVSGHFCCWCC